MWANSDNYSDQCDPKGCFGDDRSGGGNDYNDEFQGRESSGWSNPQRSTRSQLSGWGRSDTPARQAAGPSSNSGWGSSADNSRLGPNRNCRDGGPPGTFGWEGSADNSRPGPNRNRRDGGGRSWHPQRVNNSRDYRHQNPKDSTYGQNPNPDRDSERWAGHWDSDDHNNNGGYEDSRPVRQERPRSLRKEAPGLRQRLSPSNSARQTRAEPPRQTRKQQEPPQKKGRRGGNVWTAALKAARDQLGITGWAPVKRGTQLYAVAMKHKQAMTRSGGRGDKSDSGGSDSGSDSYASDDEVFAKQRYRGFTLASDSKSRRR